MSYLQLPGTSGHYASTPDHNDLDVTGDIDIRVRIRADDYTTGGNEFFIAKYVASAGNRSWRFGINSSGSYEFRWSEDGSASIAENVATGLTDGTLYWVRVTLDVDNGASNYDCKFWSAPGNLSNPDAGDFTQTGTTQNGSGTTSIHSSGTIVTVGSTANGGENFPGDYYRAQIYDGIDGTLVADFLADDFSIGDSDTATAADSTGKTWTINGANSEILGGISTFSLMGVG